MRTIRSSQTMIDPRTGVPLKPAGYRKNGRPIWPIMGAAEGDGDTGDAGTGDAGDAGDTGTDAGTDKGADDSADKTKDDATDKGADDSAADGDDKKFDKAYVQKLRDEAAKARTEGQSTKAVLDAINKALNPDAAGEKVDPVKLQAQLADSTTAHTDLQREHQVLLSAIDAGADHKRLLDSRSFLAKVAKLDTTADDFAKKVKAEIETAIKEDPKLKSGQASGSSSADHGGSVGSVKRTEAPSMQDAVNTALGT